MTPPESAYKMSAVSAENSDELVMQELQQVYYIAAHIRDRLPRHVELQDLVNAGVVGLLEASRSFDTSKNVQFKTFARYRIRGAIFDSLREMDWGSRLMRRRAREIAEATARLESRFGYKPSDVEIATELETDVEQLRKTVAHLDALQVTGQRVSSSEHEEGTIDLIESAPNLDDPDAFEICLNGEMRDHLSDAISTLSEREQLILSLYYREELTMKEIAAVVGVVMSRVSQIRVAALAKLRRAMAHTAARVPPRRTPRQTPVERA